MMMMQFFAKYSRFERYFYTFEILINNTHRPRYMIFFLVDQLLCDYQDFGYCLLFLAH